MAEEHAHKLATPITTQDPAGFPPTLPLPTALVGGGETAEGRPPSTPSRKSGPKTPVHVGEVPQFEDFEILEIIGRGGNGVVYKARQKSLPRLVAIKMILAGEEASTTQLSRFKAEASAVARLEHPNIVNIYAVGELDGAPYLVLEYVPGGSLAARIQGQALSPRVAASLVKQVAEAMQHAHERGIIHRDLKPGNILLQIAPPPVDTEADTLTSTADTLPQVDELTQAIPKVTDFGLAKSVDATRQTATGTVMGTVHYMAPEQAEGRSAECTPATDVYGLGAILYELLTGKPPFSGVLTREILARICLIDPDPIPTAPRDLETICLKCLQKDPANRYPSARELANDLQRFLHGESVHARPPSSIERLGRFLKRRRWQVATATLATLTVLILLGSFLVRAHLDSRARAREQAVHQTAVDHLEAARERLTRMSVASSRDAEQLLTEIRTDYQTIRLPTVNDATAERGASACVAVARELARKGLKWEALEACQVATDIYSGLLRKSPDRLANLQAQAQVRLLAGEILANFRDYERADQEYHLALRELSDLAAAQPDDRAVQLQLAEAHHLLGTLQVNRQERIKAITSYRTSLELRKRLAELDRTNRAYQRDLARSYGYLGDVYLELGRFAEAQTVYQQAEAIRARLAAQARDDLEARWQLARSYGNTGNLMTWQGKRKEALAGYQRSRALHEELVRAAPGVADYTGDLSWTYLKLAELSLDEVAGGTPEIGQMLDRAERMLTQLNEGSQAQADQLAAVHLCRAKLLQESNPQKARAELAEARGELEALLARDRKQHRPENPEDQFSMAIVEALEATLAGTDAHGDKARRLHNDEALLRLRMAVDGGYRNVARLRQDRAFAPLWKLAPERMMSLVDRCQVAQQSERSSER